MPCDFCSSANGKYFRVVFGGTVRNYCAQCAGQFQRGDALALQMAILNAPNQTNAGDVDKSCPECGMRFETMQKRGRVGCAGCYRAFENEISSLMVKISGAARHIEENDPEEIETNETERRLMLLKGELAQAVSLENYELAAQLRDTINALQCSGGNEQ